MAVAPAERPAIVHDTTQPWLMGPDFIKRKLKQDCVLKYRGHRERQLQMRKIKGYLFRIC